MQIPIPDDWDGETWACVEVQWPDSDKYFGILFGLLTMLLRGRLYDERTGSIKDAQAVGWEIHNRNFPLRLCSGDVIEKNDDTIVYIGCDDDCDCEDDMGCVLPVGSIVTINGVLHYRTCDGYLPVENWEGTVIVNPPPEGESDDPNDPLQWPCNKAAGISSALFDILGDIYTAISALGSVYEMYQPIQKIISQYGATWQDSQAIAAAYANNSADVDTFMGAAATNETWFRCVWDAVLAGTDTLSSSEQYAMVSSINQSSQFTAGGKLFALTVFQRLGLNTWAWVARLTHDNLANCDCPGAFDGPLDPVTGGWYLGAINSTTINLTYVKDESYTHICKVSDKHVYGIFQWAEVVTQSGTISRWSKAGSFGGCNHDVMVTAHGSSANYSIPIVNCQMDDTPMTALYDAMESSGAATGKTKQTDTLGPRSKVVDSEIASAGQVMQHMYFGQMASAGQTATITVYWRYVHNNTDTSHP